MQLSFSGASPQPSVLNPNELQPRFQNHNPAYPRFPTPHPATVVGNQMEEMQEEMRRLNSVIAEQRGLLVGADNVMASFQEQRNLAEEFRLGWEAERKEREAQSKALEVERRKLEAQSKAFERERAEREAQSKAQSKALDDMRAYLQDVGTMVGKGPIRGNSLPQSASMLMSGEPSHGNPDTPQPSNVSILPKNMSGEAGGKKYFPQSVRFGGSLGAKDGMTEYYLGHHGSGNDSVLLNGARDFTSNQNVPQTPGKPVQNYRSELVVSPSLIDLGMDLNDPAGLGVPIPTVQTNAKNVDMDLTGLLDRQLMADTKTRPVGVPVNIRPRESFTSATVEEKEKLAFRDGWLQAMHARRPSVQEGRAGLEVGDSECPLPQKMQFLPSEDALQYRDDHCQQRLDHESGSLGATRGVMVPKHESTSTDFSAPGGVVRRLPVSRGQDQSSIALSSQNGDTGSEVAMGSGVQVSPADEPRVALVPDRRKLDMKFTKYDGKSALSDYLLQFGIICRAQGITGQLKAHYLVASLTGSAQEILSRVPEEKLSNFEVVVATLKNRFEPENMYTMYQHELSVRKRKSSQSIPEFSHETERLVRKAYPTVDEDTFVRLSVEKFVNGLGDFEHEKFVTQRKPKTINDACEAALDYESLIARHGGASHQILRRTQFHELDQTGHSVLDSAEVGAVIRHLSSDLNPIGKRQKTSGSEQGVCWACYEQGHFKGKCPLREKYREFMQLSRQSSIEKWRELVQQGNYSDTSSVPAGNDKG